MGEFWALHAGKHVIFLLVVKEVLWSEAMSCGHHKHLGIWNSLRTLGTGLLVRLEVRVF